MSARKPELDWKDLPRITRRQLLRWVPAFAALAGAAQAHGASAAPIPPDGSTPSSPSVANPASIPPALDMPFRTRKEAVAACTRRRYWEEGRTPRPASPLEALLGNRPLVDSRLSLANWPLADETEDLNLGHFNFPISPFNMTADDGAQQFLLFSNTQVIANFRNREYLEQVQRRIFDRAVWAMDSGRIGTAIVEFDRAVADQKVRRIVQLLGYYGIKSIIWGNELNDPHAPWRDDLPALFEILSVADRARKEFDLGDIELCLPAMAYYEHGEYLTKMLRSFKELQRRKYPRDPDSLPVQRVTDHYYGPVEDLLPRVQIMRGIMSSEGQARLKYDLSEVGRPTPSPGQPGLGDAQLAEGFIPQVSALAVGSGMVDRVCYYALLDESTDHSVMAVADGRLVARPTYRALVVMAKLLSGLRRVSLVEEKDRVRVEGTRGDGIDFQVMWSKVQDQDLWVDLPQGKRAFDALGQEVKPERPNQIALKPKQHPILGGPARVILGRTAMASGTG